MSAKALPLLLLVGVVGPAWAGESFPGAPDWLNIEGSYRLRYEILDHPFRRGATGSDQILAQRLLVLLEARGESWFAGAELEDSRGWLDDTGTPVGTDDVNTLEPLQAYVGWRGAGVLAAGDSLDVRFGRVTIDAGSRRLVARNRFRNTLNAFTGLYGQWQGDAGGAAQAFIVTPVQRQPLRPAALRDNEQDLDHESTDDVLWGLWLARQNLRGGMAGELYALGLHESTITDRDVYTLGGRLSAAPAADAWDFEVEAALQFGRSQDLLSGVTARQDVRAGFAHLHVGRTIAAAWSPRLVAEFDYVSGDERPDDSDNNRFDTMFGARRFDFGPTGIYGALARNNLISPGARLELKPTPALNAMVGYRAAFLASDRDFMVTALLRDPAGDSGDFVGQQLEAALRFVPPPGMVQLEVGGAYLLHERFLEEAPNAVNEGNTVYAYVQATLSF